MRGIDQILANFSRNMQSQFISVHKVNFMLHS